MKEIMQKMQLFFDINKRLINIFVLCQQLSKAKDNILFSDLCFFLPFKELCLMEVSLIFNALAIKQLTSYIWDALSKNKIIERWNINFMKKLSL
jgi:hypothetical protein